MPPAEVARSMAPEMNPITLAQILNLVGILPSSARGPLAGGRSTVHGCDPRLRSQKIPQCLRPGRWDRIGSAREIAVGDLAGRSGPRRGRPHGAVLRLGRREFEEALGDSGKSKGIVQLQGVSEEVAFTPLLALRAWQKQADAVACDGTRPTSDSPRWPPGAASGASALVRRMGRRSAERYGRDSTQRTSEGGRGGARGARRRPDVRQERRRGEEE